MLEALGALLPFAVGVTMSPLPVMVVIVMLVAPGGAVRATAFLAAWLAGLLVVGAVVLAVVDVATDAEGGDPGILGAIVKLALGVLLLAAAARGWRGRPRPGDVPALPGWMRSLDRVPVTRALAIGATLAAVKPKNLALTAAAATSIAEAGLDPLPSTGLLLVYALLASTSVAAPLLATLAAGDSAPAMLSGWKAWLEANNAVLTVMVLVVFGAVLVGQGVSGLG